MQIKPDEITSILRSRIEGLDAGSAELTEVGTVLSVADGIARINPHARTGASWVPAWPTQRRLHALQAAGWTQTEIATNTGLAQALISKISTG